MHDKIGKEAIALKGWFTTQDDILCQNTAMKTFIHGSILFSHIPSANYKTYVRMQLDATWAAA